VDQGARVELGSGVEGRELERGEDRAVGDRLDVAADNRDLDSFKKESKLETLGNAAGRHQPNARLASIPAEADDACHATALAPWPESNPRLAIAASCPETEASVNEPERAKTEKAEGSPPTEIEAPAPDDEE